MIVALRPPSFSIHWGRIESPTAQTAFPIFLLAATDPGKVSKGRKDLSPTQQLTHPPEPTNPAINQLINPPINHPIHPPKGQCLDDPSCPYHHGQQIWYNNDMEEGSLWAVCPGDEVGGWVGGWVGWIDEIKAVRTRCWTLWVEGLDREEEGDSNELLDSMGGYAPTHPPTQDETVGDNGSVSSIPDHKVYFGAKRLVASPTHPPIHPPTRPPGNGLSIKHIPHPPTHPPTHPGRDGVQQWVRHQYTRPQGLLWGKARGMVQLPPEPHGGGGWVGGWGGGLIVGGWVEKEEEEEEECILHIQGM